MGDSVGRQSALGEFGFDILKADFVNLVNSDCDINQLVGFANQLGNAGEYLAVVELDGHAHPEAAEDLVDNLQQLYFVDQRVRAYDVGIALIKLAVATLLRPVGTPYGLYLETFEGHLQLVAVLHYKPGKRHREVVAQATVAQLCCQGSRVTGKGLGSDAAHEIARVKDFEEQLVALLAIFAHQGREVLHSRCLNLPVTEQAEDLANSIEYIVATRHLERRKIARTFWCRRFLCHNVKYFLMQRYTNLAKHICMGRYFQLILSTQTKTSEHTWTSKSQCARYLRPKARLS